MQLPATMCEQQLVGLATRLNIPWTYTYCNHHQRKWEQVKQKMEWQFLYTSQKKLIFSWKSGIFLLGTTTQQPHDMNAVHQKLWKPDSQVIQVVFFFRHTCFLLKNMMHDIARNYNKWSEICAQIFFSELTIRDYQDSKLCTWFLSWFCHLFTPVTLFTRLFLCIFHLWGTMTGLQHFPFQVLWLR
jgi:hypothetical protein